MIEYRLSPPVGEAELNALFAASWPAHRPTAFAPVLARSLVYVCAYSNDELIGYVNLAWDGGIHAFLLDTTVRPDLLHQGVGTGLVREAIAAARGRGVHWIHVDFEPSLRPFYAACGFRPTEAGLIRLADRDAQLWPTG